MVRILPPVRRSLAKWNSPPMVIAIKLESHLGNRCQGRHGVVVDDSGHRIADQEPRHDVAGNGRQAQQLTQAAEHVPGQNQNAEAQQRLAVDRRDGIVQQLRQHQRTIHPSRRTPEGGQRHRRHDPTTPHDAPRPGRRPGRWPASDVPGAGTPSASPACRSALPPQRPQYRHRQPPRTRNSGAAEARWRGWCVTTVPTRSSPIASGWFHSAVTSI